MTITKIILGVNQISKKQKQKDPIDRLIINYAEDQIRSVGDYEKLLVKCVLLINGAAAIALLAFIGNIWLIEDRGNTIADLILALKIFIYGVVSAIFGVVINIVSSNEISGLLFGFRKRNIIFVLIAFWIPAIFTLISLVLFMHGSLLVIDAFQNHLLQT